MTILTGPRRHCELLHGGYIDTQPSCRNIIPSNNISGAEICWNIHLQAESRHQNTVYKSPQDLSGRHVRFIPSQNLCILIHAIVSTVGSLCSYLRPVAIITVTVSSAWLHYSGETRPSELCSILSPWSCQTTRHRHFICATPLHPPLLLLPTSFPSPFPTPHAMHKHVAINFLKLRPCSFARVPLGGGDGF